MEYKQEELVADIHLPEYLEITSHESVIWELNKHKKL